MFLTHLFLQNFRNYEKKEFNFSQKTTLIVGPNTAGKTNLLEAIYMLSSGKSFREDKDENVIRFNEILARIRGVADDVELELVIAKPQNKYLLNGVSKKRVDFSGNLKVVLFSPTDLEIVIGSPFRRREFLDNVFSQIDRDYRLALQSFEKGLRQRNALLQKTKELGKRNEREFLYWDNLLIQNGEVVAKKREELIAFINNSPKDIFDFVASYDKSVISKERLMQYQEAEVAAGVTLVGPHRDDFSMAMFNNSRRTTHDLKIFGSRGQQRLVVLQLKLLELLFIEKKAGVSPLLLLDDIFSELDKEHIDLILENTLLRQGYGGQRQAIMTTTHKEFFSQKFLRGMDVIELKKE